MTSFLEVDAADERHVRLASRKAVVAAQTRINNQYGSFISSQGREGLAYLKEEIDHIVAHAAEEFGAEPRAMYDAVMEYFESRLTDEKESTTKEAAVHESRKPKMCPFHRDVVDISLAEGSAKAGFDAMAQHWGGPRHCDGEGYDGSKCNFKPQMVTQSWWDEKAEKAEERKQQRAEQAELDAQQAEEQLEEGVTEVQNVEPIDEPSAVETIETEPQGAEVIDFPAGDAPEAPAGEEIPMSMAAKTADDTTGLGGPVPTIDKRKWTPQTVPFLDDVDDASGRNPTRHKDITETIKPVNADKLEEIGEHETEHQDVSKDTNAAKTEGQSAVWSEGPKTAISAADDIHTNPITELVREGYDGFLPEAEVQQAIAAVRK